MKKIIIMLVFCLLSVSLFAQTKTEPKRYKIGDIGQGGGIVFFVESNKYFEYSENLGKTKWIDAITLAKNYRGGGYSDWYLPTKEELNYIYENLRAEDFESEDDMFWSSSGRYYYDKWLQNSRNGNQSYCYLPSNLDVCFVRTFTP